MTVQRFPRLSFHPVTSRALAASREDALALGFARIHPEHMLLALLRTADAVTEDVLRDQSCNGPALRTALLAGLPRGTHSEEQGPDLAYTPRAARVLHLAVDLAEAADDRALYPEHVLLAILVQDQGLGARTARAAGLAEDGLQAAMRSIVRPARGRP